MSKKHARLPLFVGLLVLTISQPVITQADEPKQADTPKILSAGPLEIPADSDTRTRLTIERRNAGLKALQSSYQLYQGGQHTVRALLDDAKRALDSALAVRGTDRVQQVATHLLLARHMELFVEKKFENGLEHSANREAARYWRLDVELELLAAKKLEAGK